MALKKNAVETEIINQPYSGEYKEKVYDIESPWNSQSWTWVKFTDSKSVTVGQFRGSPVEAKYSKKFNEILVLTSDYIFRLKAPDLNLIETLDQPQYQDLEVSPDGIFIFHTFYEIEKFNSSLSDISKIDSPFEMDDIKFKKWNKEKLEFECEEFSNWSRRELMELDTIEWKIKIKTPHNNI